MARMWDVAAEDVKLGPVTAESSGAVALFQDPLPRVQTPWMRVVEAAHYDDGARTSLLLETCPRAGAWLAALDGAVRAGLAGWWTEERGSLEAAFPAVVSDGRWRVSVPASCARFGDRPAAGTHVALLVDFLGAWLWRERVGLKTRITQLKAVNGRAQRTAPPTATAPAPGCSPGTSAAGPAAPA